MSIFQRDGILHMFHEAALLLRQLSVAISNGLPEVTII